MDRATTVPTDTLVWGYSTSSEVVVSRLIGPGGEVAVDERFVTLANLGGPGGFPVLRPQTDLEPNTRYTIETWFDTGGAGATEVATFTTGPGPIGDTVPAPPALVSMDTETGARGFDLPSPTRWVTLQFEEHSGILVADDGGAESLDASDGWLIEASEVDAALEASGPAIVWITGGSTLRMGISDCLFWPQGAGDRIDARFGLLDVAGNFSGWVESPIEIPSAAEARATADAEAIAEGRAQNPPRNIWGHREGSCALGAPIPSRGPGGLLASLAFGLAAAAGRRARVSRPARS
jgi:hypothetical protein